MLDFSASLLVLPSSHPIFQLYIACCFSSLCLLLLGVISTRGRTISFPENSFLTPPRFQCALYSLFHGIPQLCCIYIFTTSLPRLGCKPTLLFNPQNLAQFSAPPLPNCLTSGKSFDLSVLGRSTCSLNTALRRYLVNVRKTLLNVSCLLVDPSLTSPWPPRCFLF